VLIITPTILELSSELFKAINESIPEKSKKALEVK
jgi:hypothetical protein